MTLLDFRKALSPCIRACKPPWAWTLQVGNLNLKFLRVLFKNWKGDWVYFCCVFSLSLVLNNSRPRLIFLPFCNQSSKGLWPQPKTNAELAQSVLKLHNSFSYCIEPYVRPWVALVAFFQLSSARRHQGASLWTSAWPPSPPCHWPALGDHQPDSPRNNSASDSVEVYKLKEQKRPCLTLTSLALASIRERFDIE